MKNYAFTRGLVLPDIENGHSFNMFNFMQVKPNTSVFVGKTGLTFKNCNLVNCVVPEDSIVEKCQRTQRLLCSHLHPKWIARGLDECELECSHMIDKAEVKVDGILIDTVYAYEDTLNG